MWSDRKFAMRRSFYRVNSLLAYDTSVSISATRESVWRVLAAIAHVVYSPDVRHPVKIGADQEDQLVTWLAKRLGAQLKPPKLGPLGFELIGGRLLPGNEGPVAQFMYHDASGQRLTLYVTTEHKSQQNTAFRFSQEGPVNVFYWVDGQFGYAISAGIDKGKLVQVAQAVYDQINPK